ncbi:MAG: response regulator [Desulfobacterales bacterium]|nr:response regulator [Candidatus Omnitrophota bacterium]MBU4425921.1 response regulator [Pseudomonadota bacterium]MCG2774765.1 response regulator [Desulfobacterales bacterium]
MKEKKILVVDDDLHMRIFISIVLETSGYKAIVTKDGKEGIREAKEAAPALIILDLMMPREGGVLMYRQLKVDKNLKDIPVIILSGVESRAFSHSLKMLNMGQDDPIPEPEAYMEKPPKAEELVNIIETLLKDTN